MARILLTAIGSFSAADAIRTYKTAGHPVIGCDMYPKTCVGSALDVDAFYRAPPAEEGGEYVDFMLRLCREEGITHLIPLIDPEVDLLCGRKSEFEAFGCRLCIPDESAVRLCRDKHRLSSYLIERGIEDIVPSTLLSECAVFSTPIIVKPVSGRSSQGCERVCDAEKLTFLKNRLDARAFIVQPLLAGRIVAADVVRDPADGAAVCVARRELLRTPSGAGTTVEILEDPLLEDRCAAIAEAVGAVGAINMEFVETAPGVYRFLEINPRFSAGMAFTHLAGYDVAGNHLNCFSGIRIAPRGTIRKMVIARRYQEIVTECR